MAICPPVPSQREARHRGDLDRVEGLLGRLRAFDALRERKRGLFLHRSRAFLHFHGDGDDVYADVRLADDFVRHRVTTPAEQSLLVAEVEAVLNRPR